MTMANNGLFIDQEMKWLSDVITQRLNLYFKNGQGNEIVEVRSPQETVPDSPYADFIRRNQLNTEDRILLALTFVPHIRPQLFDCFFIKNSTTGARFAEFGGIVPGNEGVMIPTLQTFLFITAGEDLGKKIELASRFSSHPVFGGKSFIRQEVAGTTDYSIAPSRELVENLLFGRAYSPGFSTDFPAKRISTTREWTDLVLDPKTLEQLDLIRKWLEYGDTLMVDWGMRGKLKEGFRALFYGPSGTGKTLSASLLGKLTGKDVFCIDLSMIVSKYIGETEKNLSRVFDTAEGKGWILFFDEADALFGKRTGLKDSHDRYANQEIAFLLQRVENFDGLVVLSTNMKSNLDEAFARRFQSVIRFKMPDPAQRSLLWRSTFSDKAEFEPGLDLDAISAKYEISGGSILNVVQYCSLMSLSRNSNLILLDDLVEGIRLEYKKEGKTMI